MPTVTLDTDAGGATATAERARVAVAVVFAINGVAFASWLSRLPAVRDALSLTPARLGLLLLCMSTGAVLALPLSGPLVHRLGPARTVLLSSLTVAIGLVTVAAGVALAAVPLTGLGLLFTGVAVGTWDVSMNVEGADVENRLGRVIMPRFHAGYSIGTVAGALLGAAAAAAGLPVAVQLAATAVFVVIAVAVAVRRFLPWTAPSVADRSQGSGAARAWREPRTLLIGVLVLAFAFTEGTANDWLALAIRDGHHTADATGALGFGCFVAGMTACRVVGGSLLERYGRPLVLRCTAGLALAGLLVVVYGPTLGWVIPGTVLWGAGAALGFPVGMSAAADDPERAAARVSVVSSVGYTAFLAGPPLLGFLANEFGILHALLVVMAALVVGLVAATATRPPAVRPVQAAVG